jgi:4-amino-4-deoxy-L-arabinose transferase-like glycosyltransferase
VYLVIYIKILTILPVHQRFFSNTLWVILACLLLLPALLINLGLMTFIDDEAIRALVALEMKWSGNFITPTLHGEYYYNKPPLFNWILLVFFELSGRVDEFTARIPTVLALLGYAASVFFVFRRHYGSGQAVLAAFMLITCGRVLFWDAMLALIDCTFSWVIFGMFMTVYHFFEKGKWTVLFLGAYLLGAIGFLLKGLPAVVFLGLTLSGYFLFRGALSRLLSWQHILGILVFTGVVGTYYSFYLQFNALDTVFQTLFSESSKRTVVNYGLGRTVMHVFTFPFEMVYHFFPWSLMAIFVLDREVWSRIRRHPFTACLAVIFLSNIWVYWISPEVYPRYLLMFVPLVFGIFLDLRTWHSERGTIHTRIFLGILVAMAASFFIAAFLPFFLGRLQIVPNWPLKSIFLGIASGLAFWKMTRNVSVWGVPMAIIVLLLFRIGFNWFVLPDRNAHDFGKLCRETSLLAGKAYRDERMLVYKKTDMQPTNSFYLTIARGSVIPRDLVGSDTSALYIIDPNDYPDIGVRKVSEIKVRHGALTYDIGPLSE